MSYQNPSNVSTGLKEQQLLDLQLVDCGREACAPGQFWGPGRRDYFLIHYIYHGRGIFETNGRVYRLAAGQGFLISPDQLAGYRADDHQPWSYVWLAFNGRYAARYLQQTGLAPTKPVFYCYQGNLLLKCVIQIIAAGEGHPVNELRLLSGLYLFLALIKEGSGNGQLVQQPVKHRDCYIQRALDFIETNYSKNRCLAELAEYLGLNRNYQTKIFKAATGRTPRAYLTDYRIQKACELLKATCLTVGEIANVVGYSDQLRFSRLFKQHCGIAPRSYRERVGEERF